MTTRLSHNVWQNVCTAELTRCAQLPKWRRQSEWRIARRYFLDFISKARTAGFTSPNRIIFADLDARKLDLSGFDLSYSYIIRADFSSTRLCKTDFTQSIIRESNLLNADVSGSRLSKATFASTVKNIGTIVYDDHTRFDIRTGDIPPIEFQFLQDRIKADTRRYQDNKKKSAINRLFLRVTNHGRSITPIFFGVITLYILGIFPHFYYVSYGKDYDLLWPLIWKSSLLSSEAVLGIDPSTDINDKMWQSIFNFQSALGLMFMALLIAALTHKTTSPANDA